MERIVITGASAGIGAACVEAFQQRGVEVLGLDRASSSDADDHLQIDLADPACGERLLEFCAGRAVDGLVNNAAVALNKVAVDTTTEDFDRIVAVNLRAPLLLSSALQPTLAACEGFVVNVASVHAIATSESVAAYAASKGGLIALTRALALEWAPEVRVNAVAPGAVNTEMFLRGLGRKGSTLDDLRARHPLQRIAEPYEIAAAVIALANLSFATGTVLVVDGGATTRLSTE